MNARTARLLRRVAHVVTVTEHRVAALQGKGAVPPSYNAQLAELKRAWKRTPRPQRNAARWRCVNVFNAIEGGGNA
jgi:hypothetical protein